MYLSKACDCLPYVLLIANLGAYGIDRISLTILMGYLNSFYNNWSEIKRGIIGGSVLRYKRLILCYRIV